VAQSAAILTTEIPTVSITRDDYHRLTTKSIKEPAKGLDRGVDYVKGLWRQRTSVRTKLWDRAGIIDNQAKQLADIDESELQQKLAKCAQQIQLAGSCPDHLLNQAMALLVVAAARSVGLRPYRVQIMGALALYRGTIAEMATGEGKSLTVGLASILAGWSKKPCHVLTANDYLAARDEESMRDFYQYCGVSSASVTSETEPSQRQACYNADITYTTSSLLLGDYLRDRLQLGQIKQFTRRLILDVFKLSSASESGSLRGLHTVFVDEADSIMIDEAVVPLVISRVRENPRLLDAVTKAGELASHLVKDSHYLVDHKHREIKFTEQGTEVIDRLAESLPGLWQGQRRRQELVEQALVAREFYELDKDYVIVEGAIVLIDEFTGRLMPDRNLSLGLHQALEIAEGLEATHPTETLARYNFQRFFCLFEKLGGTSGTADEARHEFWHIYQLAVLKIPRNCHNKRLYLDNNFYLTKAQKHQAVLAAVLERHQQGQPILIGTKTVFDSELLAESFSEAGLNFELLNAPNHAQEADIIKVAGLAGGITIATNMAGRGTDIKLGEGVAELGGLHVIATELHESSRVDRQLSGRCARQADPGSVEIYCCLEDELITRFVPRWKRRVAKHWLANKWLGHGVLTPKLFNKAQHEAQHIAQLQRHQVMKMDSWIDDSLWFGRQISKN